MATEYPLLYISAQHANSRTYGSGYPGVAGRGTTGRGFPFVFWPIAWPLAIGGGVATGSYLHNNYEVSATRLAPVLHLMSLFYSVR